MIVLGQTKKLISAAPSSSPFDSIPRRPPGVISGSSFHIRTVMEKDLDDLIALLGDTSKQGEFLPINLVSQSLLRQEFIKNGFFTDDFQRLVMVDGQDRIIGSIWVFRSVPYFDALELGYKLFHRKDWGKGLMTEAVSLVVDHLFSSRTVNRLEIRCDVANEASAKVAQKLGFRHEGIARQAT
ncbi:MAG: GNAT family N-acetyltransferase [Rhizobiales bacterium]|nr:GNAT family N-acetyltransferase [Hyphomicrobiales bacterium]